MTPGEVVLHAALWLEANHPPLRGSWVDCSDPVICTFMNWKYPTGMRGFVEDLSQSTAVS